MLLHKNLDGQRWEQCIASDQGQPCEVVHHIPVWREPPGTRVGEPHFRIKELIIPPDEFGWRGTRVCDVYITTRDGLVPNVAVLLGAAQALRSAAETFVPSTDDTTRMNAEQARAKEPGEANAG